MKRFVKTELVTTTAQVAGQFLGLLAAKRTGNAVPQHWTTLTKERGTPVNQQSITVTWKNH